MNRRSSLRRATVTLLGGVALAAPFVFVSPATASAADQFAGSYVDASGTTVTNVTTEAAAQDIRAAGGTARVVDDSLSQLRAVQTGLDRFAGSAGAVGLSWGVDIASNAVVVNVPAGDTDAATKALLTQARGAGDVRINRVAAAPQLTLAPGDAILTGGSRCSTSAIGIAGGTTYVITAGHCTNIGSRWTTSGGQLIGQRQLSSFPGNDYGTIRVTNTALPTTNGQRTSVGSPPAGSQIQKAGSTTGITSGRLVGYGRTVNYSQGSVFGMIETTACVQPGDSGGSLYQGSIAIGITSGGTVGGCRAGFQSFFQPLQEALSAQGARLK